VKGFVRTRVLVVVAAAICGVLVFGSAAARSAATNCEGTYAGPNTWVIVPQGATCTFLPGTSVGAVTVEPHAKLFATDVTIGGTLTVYGFAMVCGSTISRVYGDGGRVVLGGPNCDGDNVLGSVATDGHWSHITVENSIIGRNLLLRRDAGVTVKGNSVSRDLFVRGDHGTIDIENNEVGHDLTVRDDGGPTIVVENSAGHDAICRNDKNLGGFGNSAGRHNTCPAGRPD